MKSRRFIAALVLSILAASISAADTEDLFWESVVKNQRREEVEIYLKHCRRAATSIRQSACSPS